MNNISLIQELQIDCEACSGLCCYTLYLCKGESFDVEKAAGVPCLHLQKDFRCSCYTSLHQRHMKGCTIYDCFGAGQYVTQALYKNRTWQDTPELQLEICRTFPLILQLHQVLYYLVSATMLPEAKPYTSQLQDAITQALALRLHPFADTINLFQAEANNILKEISNNIVSSYPNAKHISFGIQKDFKKSDLSGYDFSMSTLIAANLQGCNLTNTNFLGADMRDTNIRNTDLRKAIFLTQIQLNSAQGNQHTLIPSHLHQPTNWSK